MRTREVAKCEKVTEEIGFSSGEASVEATIENGHLIKLEVSCDAGKISIESGAASLISLASAIDAMTDYLMRHELL